MGKSAIEEERLRWHEIGSGLRAWAQKAGGRALPTGLLFFASLKSYQSVDLDTLVYDMVNR